MDLLEHFKCANEEDSRFQYAFSIDKENRLKNIFCLLLIALVGTKSMQMLLPLIPLTT